MNVQINTPLKNYTTMKLGGNARFMAEIKTPEDIANICNRARSQSLLLFVIGGGSNVIAKDNGFQGIVLHIMIPGFEIISDDKESTTIKVGAGELWDSIVERSVNMDLSGIEAMSGIPGTAGACPIQNVGAYGQEIADTLQLLEAYDTQQETFVTLLKEDCDFAYRHSIFRGEATGRYIITSITLRLSKQHPKPPFYESLQKYLDENKIKKYTPENIRKAVLAIRKNKLPDPEVMPSAGSFFKNTIVRTWQLEGLKAINKDIPIFEMADGYNKIPTGWLIEQAGFKGQLLHGIRVYENNALVLVNESATSYDDLAKARDEIIAKVKEMFKVQIQQEPLEF